MSLFRAMWPITDERLPFVALCAQAQHDIPLLAAQAHARLTGPGRWSVARSSETPGSGHVTEWVLLFESRARPAPARTIPSLDTTNQEVSTAA